MINAKGSQMTRQYTVILTALTICALHTSRIPALDKAREARRKAFIERSRIKTWPKRPWKSAYQIRTRNYTIRTNTSYRVARYIGDLMEMTAARYREIFGMRFAPMPNLTINAYATRAEYEVIAQRAGFPPGVTGGFYSPAGRGAIYLPFQAINNSHPSITLFHEGTHQFVHQVIDYKMPFSLKPKVTRDRYILVSTPIWLNEGLATYMETAYYDGDKLCIGRINQGRLYHLQKMLKRKTNPPVREVLERRYGQPFGVEHYAMAWGLVYALRHHRNTVTQAANRRKLVRYIESCKKAFYFNPMAEFARDFLAGGKLPADFDIRWNVRLGRRSRESFEKLIAGPNRTIEQWEQDWTKFILALDLDKPFGGLGKTRDVGAAGLHR